MNYVMHNLNYYAAHPGNLMNSLFALENKLKKQDTRIVYVLPEQAAERYWVQNMMQNGAIVYFKKMGKCQYAFFNDIVSKYDIRIIHTHFWDLPACLTFKRIRLCKKRKLKTIIHFHNAYTVSKNIFKEALKRLILNSDVHIGCGGGLSNALKQQSFKNVLCVTNAVDFSRLNTSARVSKADFGLQEQQKVLLLFGHDFWRKGVDLTINSLKEIAEKYDAVLAMPLSENAPSIEKIKELCGDIPSWIKILPPTNDIATYYHMADAFLSPSRSEGFCYAVLEAVYCGCYTIISNIDGHATDIPQIATFECGDQAALQAEIVAILENGQNPETMQLQKQYVEKQYSLDRWADEVVAIYNQMGYLLAK